jgi:FtsH-binding integral membrane protein
MLDTHNYARSSIAKTLFGSGSQTGGGYSSIFKTNVSDLFKVITSKKEFFILIFVNLIVQLGITYYVMETITTDLNNKDTKNKMMMTKIVVIGLVILLAFVPMPVYLKFFVFCGFSLAWGYLFSSIRPVVGEDNVRMAVLGALSIFALMFVFGAGLIVSGIKLGFKFGITLFYALLGLIIFQIMQLFIPTASVIKKTITMITLMLFSVYVVYDTNSILQRSYYGDFITASLDYYMDVLNIFVSLLSFGRD